MARYTSLFTVGASIDNLRRLLTETLRSCNFDIVYETGDYLVAREVPGYVAFAKLVTVEVLLDQLPAAQADTVRMNFVVKNEELPLQVDNHCRQKFNLVNRALVENEQLYLIDRVAS